MCMKAHWKVFGVCSWEEPINKEIVSGPRHPSMSLVVQNDFGENGRDKDNEHGAELALLGFVKKPIGPSHLMINRWCCEQRQIQEILVRGVTSPCWLSL
jgi:hypothetical protein